MIRHLWTDGLHPSVFLSIASAVAETPSRRMRVYQDVPSSGPEVGSVMPFNGQSHAKSPVTNRAPVPDDTAVVTVSPPSKLRRPSWPPQVAHRNGGTHPRPLVRPYTVPSFASEIPGPSSSTAAQQSAIGSTHPEYLSSYDPSVNRVNESYPFPPDSATLLSGAELLLAPPTLSSKAKGGAVKARSNSDLSARTANTGSRLFIPELMGMQQVSTGRGYNSSDGRRRMEGVSLPASVVPLHYLSLPKTHVVPMRTSEALVSPTQ
jgi:hypothetical protein